MSVLEMPSSCSTHTNLLMNCCGGLNRCFREKGKKKCVIVEFSRQTQKHTRDYITKAQQISSVLIVLLFRFFCLQAPKTINTYSTSYHRFLYTGMYHYSKCLCLLFSDDDHDGHHWSHCGWNNIL